MAAGSGDSAAGVLTQLSEVSNSSSGEQDNKVDDTISIISYTSTGSMSLSEPWDGDSSSVTTIDSITRKYYSKLRHQI